MAARLLFHEQGYEATAIATVLREADANSGSLYQTFERGSRACAAGSSSG
jgi:AcrR family transcriptional regulator